MKVFFLIGLLNMAASLFFSTCSSAKFADIKAVLPDINGKADGQYIGSYKLSGTPVNVTLDITVQGGNITTIKIIKHACSPIGKKAEKITERIVERQSLDVDVISGATGSSMAILKAVENALQQE